jgi:polyhydroxyalkanoate synthase
MSSHTTDSSAAIDELAQFKLRCAQALHTVRGLSDVIPGSTPRDALYTQGKVTLYRYRSGAKASRRPRVLIIYAQVNRPSVLDLEPDRSMIAGLLAHGLDVYLLDWGYPDRADRHTTLSDYVLRDIDRAVQTVGKSAPIHLLGVCQGGTLSLIYASLEPQRIKKLVTMVTPVDFQTDDNVLSKWVRGVDIKKLVASVGNVPGAWLNAAFLSLMPFRLTLQKYLTLVDHPDQQEVLATFLRMEQWIFDSPDQAGAAFAEFVTWFYQENRFVNGTLSLAGRAARLDALRMPILNIYATEDHLVPPAASKALGALVRSERYEELAVQTGHIGIYVGSRAHTLPPKIAAWLKRL